MALPGTVPSSSKGIAGATTLASYSSLLGAQCSVRLPESSPSRSGGATSDKRAVAQGTLLEVRWLWIPPPPPATRQDASEREVGPSEPSGSCSQRPLYAFVRLKDTDHRLSGWFPLHRVELRHPPSGANCDGALAGLVTAPLLSSTYREVTPGMARTQRAMKPLDFLEERLLRDCKTPTTIRFFVYLQAFLFAPWYYAPYGLLYPDYDPVMPVPVEWPTPFPNADLTGGGGGGVALQTNPFIKDAFLCPFSLRIFTTFAQLRYETLMYRSRQLLRPPGVEVYRDDERGLSVFEINGSRQVTYCRNLFLIGKSFLENKLAGHDVHNYMFYVVGLHQHHFPNYIDNPSAIYFVGFFTWEKQVVECNLACIVTLPCFAGGDPTPQRQPDAPAAPPSTVPLNIGQFMIALSYELAYRRGHVGSPEKPLSDLGAAAYGRFWRRRLVRWMCERPQPSRQLALSAAKGGARGSGGGRKRPRRAEGEMEEGNGDSLGAEAVNVDEESGAEEDEKPAGGEEGVTVVSVREIAGEVGLEEADVLKTLLSMGLLHRSAEDRSIQLLIPTQYAHWEWDRLTQLQGSTHYAIFISGKLRTKQTHSSIGRRHSNVE